MNTTVDLAKQALEDPPRQVTEVLDDDRVPKQAKQAVESLGYKSNQQDQHKSDTAKTHPTSAPGEGRLQVVNEKQEFRLVEA